MSSQRSRDLDHRPGSCDSREFNEARHATDSDSVQQPGFGVFSDHRIMRSGAIPRETTSCQTHSFRAT